MTTSELIHLVLKNEKYSDLVVAQKLNKQACFRPQRNLPSIMYSRVAQLFCLILCVMYNFLTFVKSLFSKRLDSSENEIFIFSSDKSKIIFDNLEIGDGLRIDMGKASFLHYVNMTSKVKSIVYSIISILKINNLSDVYYYHDAYKLASFFYFLQSMEAEKVHFTNHYDRWGVLIDKSRIPVKIQYQHGVVSEDFTPPVKLERISHVYCYDERSVEIWKKNINGNDKSAYSLFKIKIFFKEVEGGGSVLVISNPLYFEDELSLLHKLNSKLPSVPIYYKTHPIYKYDEEKIPNFIIRVAKKEYPDCSVSITRGSTLGKEYEANGKSVIWWESDAKVDDAFLEIKELLISKGF